ncbi:MAG: hypothetical protein J1F32_00805 [Erysipelotrichales bacterium]|nr:hypothetical protein [Erysipelotrichales bacterium]
MKNLFLLDGLAGTGKSDCIEYINSKTKNFKAVIIKKFTTRPQRTKEADGNLRSDLEFVTPDEFNLKKQELKEKFIEYSYSEYDYGFSLREVEEHLLDCKNVFIIIRDIKTIKKIIELYTGIYNVVPVFIFTDTHLVVERLKTEGYTNEEIDFRLRRNQLVWEDYATQSVHIYKHTIINNSNKTDFHRLITQLLDIYNVKQQGTIQFHNGLTIKLGNSISGHTNEINTFLKNYKYEKNIFLMIKYRQNNKIVRAAIKDWVQEKEFNCIIADKHDLTHDVYNPIALSYACKYGIVVFDDAEDENAYSPNVAYELGSMQSQFKKCLIVKHKSLIGKNFFDILKDNVNTYSTPDELEPIIKQWIDEIKKD